MKKLMIVGIILLLGCEEEVVMKEVGCVSGIHKVFQVHQELGCYTLEKFEKGDRLLDKYTDLVFTPTNNCDSCPTE